jgi:glycosyltransferase involved in cell wall biosynthesis
LLPLGTPRYERYSRLRDALISWYLGPPDARRGPLPSLPEAAGSDLSVVVMAIDAPPSLAEAVESLVRQHPRPEIIVVNSGTEGAAQRIRHLDPAITVIECRRRLLPGATRNVGIAAGHGRYVAFLAADCIAQPGWVAHRLSVHRAGADVVSTPVMNLYPLNPFASASHVLLFSTRLPGTPAKQRQHFGCSYARELFGRHGLFRSDLRTSEDTEFNARLGKDARIRFVAAARTGHRGPRTPWGFLRDQFLRGRRSALAYAALGGKISPEQVARDAGGRLPRLRRAAFVATPGSDWFSLAIALPWLWLGTRAYMRGALSARHRPSPKSATAATEGHALLALLQLRNDRRFVDDYLENLAPHVDAILVLDDGSDDGGPEILAAHPKVKEILRLPARGPHRWDELRNRRLLIDAAGRHGAQWIIVVDADERVECDFRYKVDAIIASATRDGKMAFQVSVRELWDAPDQYRVDGVWNRKSNARLFRYRQDHDFGTLSFHGHWAPLNSRPPNRHFPLATLNIYHQRMIHAADRQRRRDRYVALDPERKLQKIGYDYLTDPTGMQLEKLPAGREYVPMRTPPPA